MTVQPYRPDGKGGLEPRTTSDQNWRNELRSPRWGAALPGGRLPALKNPEMNPTSSLRSILFWLGLAAITFLAVLVGYGTGFWS